ncbi:hypothetical protein EB52_02927, partial [Enterococcus faecalis]
FLGEEYEEQFKKANTKDSSFQ